jgi:hypothetical protein
MEEGGGGNWWEAVVIEDSMLIKAQDAAPGHGNNKPQDADLTGQQQQVEVPSGEAQPGASTQLQQGLTKSEAGGVKVEQVVLSVMAQQAVQWPVKYEEEGLWERYLVRWVDEQEEEVDGGEYVKEQRLACHLSLLVRARHSCTRAYLHNRH